MSTNVVSTTALVSTYFDVFSWDLDTMILGQSHTCDLNSLGVKGHLGVSDLFLTLTGMGSNVILQWLHKYVIAKAGKTRGLRTALFSSCTHGVQWAYDIPMCLSIRSQLENASWIYIDGFSWYLDTMIIRWGDNRGVQEFGVKGHLGSLFKYPQNTSLSTYELIDFDETWVRDPWPAALSGCWGNFDQRSSWGHLGVTVEGQILNSLPQQIWLCQCVVLGQPSKNIHGDLFIQPVVKGSKVRKVHFCFYEGSNV